MSEEQKLLADRLFGGPESVGVALRPAFVDHEREQLNVVGRSKADQQDFTAMITESGVNPYGLGKLLLELKAGADRANASGLPDNDPNLDGQIQKWNTEIRSELRGTYGDATDDLLARAKKFVEAHPKLHEQLSRRGNGSRPAVVTAIVEHVRRVNFR